MHIMIDIKTLAAAPDAAIIQIGAVPFELRPRGRILNGVTLNMFVRVAPGNDVVDNGMLTWRMQQPHVRDIGTGPREMPLTKALDELDAYHERVTGRPWAEVEGVWAKPSNFDLAILASAYARLGREPPWPHWTTRCVRTLFALTGGEPTVDSTGFMRHDAADDAVLQAMQVQVALAGAAE